MPIYGKLCTNCKLYKYLEAHLWNVESHRTNQHHLELVFPAITAWGKLQERAVFTQRVHEMGKRVVF